MDNKSPYMCFAGIVMACHECGKTLLRGEYIAVCKDCGAVFCEDCAKAGAFANHECEEDDFDD